MAHLRLAVFLSGRGSNFRAILAAIDRKELDASVSIVVSDKGSAPGLALAKERGIPTAVIPREKSTQSQEQFDQKLVEAVSNSGAELIVLAGYMRLLSASFVESFKNRIINIHPSLLPAFPGLTPQAQALEAGVRVSGATVHVVTAEMDAGPILGQAAVPVDSGDTEDSLSARILRVEHKLYPAVLRAISEQKISLQPLTFNALPSETEESFLLIV